MAVQIDGSQGNVIATKGTYSGSVSIGGTLTYEDVTNIDSVGIITARTSIEVGARPGVGASISSDGNAIFSGITTITQLGGSPKLTSGQTITSTANDGNASIQGGLTYPGGHIRLGGGSGDDDIRFSVSGGSGTLSEKARIDSSGNIGAGTNSPSSFSASDFVISKSANAGITISVGNAGTTNTASIFFAEGTGGTGDKERGAIKYKHGDDYLAFHTNYDERVRIDSSGRLLVGATSSQSVGGGAALTQIQSVSSTGRLTVTQHRNEAGGSPYIVLGKSRGTSLGAVTVLQSGDEIGSLAWAGADGGDMESTAARIYSAVDATPGSNDMPGRLMFATTADGADSPTERLRINAAGHMGLGETDISPVGGTYKAFDVAYKGTGISGRTDNPTLDIRSNIYFDGSNWKYGEGSTSAGLLNIGGNQLIFYSAASGTAGDTATINRKFTVDSSGHMMHKSSSSSSSSDPGYKWIDWVDGSDNRGTTVYQVCDVATGTNTFHYCYNTNGTNNGHRFSIRIDGGINNHSGNNTNLSDRREKKDIEDLPSTWESIKQWRLRKFHFKDVPEDATEYDKNYGVIAQEIEEISPEVGRDWVKEEEKKDDDGNIIQEQVMRRSVREQKIMWMAIKALQEAQTKIETLESEMAALKSS